MGSIVSEIKEYSYPTKNVYIKVKQYSQPTGNGIMLKDNLYICSDKHYKHVKKIEHGQPYRVELGI
ncbi:MAG: hypothetical protein LKI80_07545 [Sporolactobacillus sp.]|nr:hypothetical protein [Sporolactobacillus sp.]